MKLGPLPSSDLALIANPGGDTVSTLAVVYNRVAWVGKGDTGNGAPLLAAFDFADDRTTPFTRGGDNQLDVSHIFQQQIGARSLPASPLTSMTRPLSVGRLEHGSQ
jgi:hypothetical protein